MMLLCRCALHRHSAPGASYYVLCLDWHTHTQSVFFTNETVWLLLFHSAGVGRTGTFIVIDSMIDMMHMEQRVDVFGFVSRIREQRCQLIQTDVSVDPSRPVVSRPDS